MQMRSMESTDDDNDDENGHDGYGDNGDGRTMTNQQTIVAAGGPAALVIIHRGLRLSHACLLSSSGPESHSKRRDGRTMVAMSHV